MKKEIEEIDKKPVKKNIKITSLNKIEITKDFENKLIELLPEEIKEFQIISLTKENTPRQSPKWILRYCIDGTEGEIKDNYTEMFGDTTKDIIIRILKSKIT